MRQILVPWDRKPQEAADVNRDLVAATRTVWFSAFNTGRQIRDEIGGVSLTNPGGLSVGPDGQIATFNGSQQTNIAWSPPVADAEAETLIICGRILADATQSATPGAAFGIYAASGTQHGIGIGFDTSNAVGAAGLTNAGAYLSARTAGAQNVWYDVYARRENAGAGNVDTRYYAWINGQPASTGQASTQPNKGGTFDEIAVGAQHRSAGFLRQFRGRIAWASIIQMQSGADFTDDYAARLYASGYPWNLFEPRRVLVPETVASSLPTLSASTYKPGTLTSSGWTPRITAS